MNKCLVFLGDSYGAGSEIFSKGWTIGAKQLPNDDKNFTQLLGKNYNAVLNFSTVGSSILGYLEQLSEFNSVYSTDIHYDFVIMITQHIREYVYDVDKGWANVYPNMSKTDESYKILEEKIYKTIVHPETSVFNWYKSISIIQNYCLSKNNINDVYIEQFNKSPYDKKYEFLINRNKIYEEPVIKQLFFHDVEKTDQTLDWKHFLNTDNYNKYYYPNFHPNVKGHMVIANRVKEIIVDKTRL